MIRFAFLLVLSTSTAAFAQPSTIDPVSPSGPTPEVVSENTALTLSLGGTLGSYAAIGIAMATPGNEWTGYLGSVGIVGALIAPNFGEWYAGKWFTRGMALRGGGLVVSVIGLLADSEGCSLFYSGHGDPEPADCNETFRTTKGTVLIFTGLAMFVGGTVDDIVRAPRIARRRNEAARLQWAVAPVVRHDGGGLALSGSF